MFVYVLPLFFAILNVFAKPFLHNPNELRTETPRPNVKLLVSDDTLVTGCSSQPSEDSLDEDQGKGSLQKRSGSCQTNENGVIRITISKFSRSQIPPRRQTLMVYAISALIHLMNTWSLASPTHNMIYNRTTSDFLGLLRCLLFM